MAGIGSGLAGAGLGFASGGPVGAVLGGLSGLFGGSNKPQLSPEQKAQYALQSKIANQLYGFSQSAPGTAPDEIASLAQDRGLLGQQQRNTLQGLYSGMNLGQQGTSYLPSFLNSVSAQQTGQQMQLDETHMMDALSRRREALLAASNVGRAAGEMAPPGTPPSQLPQLLGQLSQALAYRKHLRDNGDSGAGITGAGQITGQPLPTGGDNQYPSGGQIATQEQQELNNPANFSQPSTGLAGDDPRYFAGAPAGYGAALPAMGAPSLPPKIGDDPAMTAILQALAKHGYHLAKKEPKGKKKKQVGDDPNMAMLGAMQQQPAGSMLGQQAPGQGAAAPGNEIGGMNGLLNQMRQSSGYGQRTMRGPGGLVWSYVIPAALTLIPFIGRLMV